MALTDKQRDGATHTLALLLSMDLAEMIVAEEEAAARNAVINFGYQRQAADDGGAPTLRNPTMLANRAVRIDFSFPEGRIVAAITAVSVRAQRVLAGATARLRAGDAVDEEVLFGADGRASIKLDDTPAIRNALAVRIDLDAPGQEPDDA